MIIYLLKVNGNILFVLNHPYFTQNAREDKRADF